VSGVKLPLTLSITGHAVCLVLLVAFMSHQAPPIPEPIAKGGIEVIFQPPPPAEAPPPPPTETPPPPEPQAEVVPPPPEPEPPPIVSEPPPPPPEAPVATVEPPPPPPPPRKRVAKKPPKPVQRREESPPMTPAYRPPAPIQPAPAAPTQTATATTPVPARVSAPEASAGYAALVSAWLNSHKRYPESAREHREEGSAVLRFEVERSGRVLSFAVVKSSGFQDLDASIEEMMRGATLPPFPSGLTEARKEYTVNVRFRLER
jgi:protein TonB